AARARRAGAQGQGARAARAARAGTSADQGGVEPGAHPAGGARCIGGTTGARAGARPTGGRARAEHRGGAGAAAGRAGRQRELSSLAPHGSGSRGGGSAGRGRESLLNNPATPSEIKINGESQPAST